MPIIHLEEKLQQLLGQPVTNQRAGSTEPTTGSSGSTVPWRRGTLQWRRHITTLSWCIVAAAAAAAAKAAEAAGCYCTLLLCSQGQGGVRPHRCSPNSVQPLCKDSRNLATTGSSRTCCIWENLFEFVMPPPALCPAWHAATRSAALAVGSSQLGQQTRIACFRMSCFRTKQARPAQPLHPLKRRAVCVTFNQARRPQHSTHIHKHTCPGANTPPARGCQGPAAECAIGVLTHMPLSLSHTCQHTCSVTSTPPTVFHGTHMIIGSVKTQDMCTDGVHGAAHITPKPWYRYGKALGFNKPANRTDQPDVSDSEWVDG